MTARRVTTTLVLVLLVTVVAPGSATVPVARLSDVDAPRPNPRECIALVEGLFPYGATGARDAVLLVHGWTGRPEAWLGEINKVVSDYNLPSDRSFADELKRLGDVDVWIIDYYEASHRWVDHPSVEGPIGAAIDCLHERYGRPIGYVAHSMGGLALRQVLAGRESKIGPVVTFGTPHLGSDIAVFLLDILDIAPDIAELVGVQLRRSQNPVAVLGGYAGPFLVEYILDGVRACGESEDPFACELLGLSIPDAVAAAYSEAGLALLAGSPQLVGGPGVTPLPPLPQAFDGRVLSIAGDVRISFSEVPTFSRQSHASYDVSPDGVLLVSGSDTVPFGVTSRGDWIVGTRSALGSGVGRDELFVCDYYLLPDPITKVLNIVIPSTRSEQSRLTVKNGACAHWALTSAREPTQVALGFLQEHLQPELAAVVTDAPTLSAARTVRGGGSEPVVVILDTSGSMAERDARGVVRMEGARSALRSLVDALPPTTNFLLRQYPDPVRATCDGGTVVIALGPLDAGRAAGELARLQPSGITPTGPALRTAVDDLRRAGFNSGQIVLISDGESNCGEPPCDAAASIVAEGFDVTVNTLGFLISDAGQRELDCIAASTGGLSFTANDAEQLEAYILSLQSAQLSVSVVAPEAVRAGSGISVEVIVANEGGIDVRDARLALAVRGDSFSPVLPPSFILGNIPAGQQVTRRWTVTTDRGAAADGPSTVEVIATSRAEEVAPVRATATVTLDDRPVSGDQAGGVMREVLGIRTSSVAVAGDGFSAGASHEGLRNRTGVCAGGDDHYGAVLYGPQVHNFACFDALISDVLRQPISSSLTSVRLSQVDAIRSLEVPPALVFLTIGMADSDIPDLLLSCTDRRAPNLSGIAASASPPADCGTDSFLLRRSLERIESLMHQRDSLPVVYQQVAQAMARDGTLVVLAYPKLFSQSTPTCAGIDRLTSQLTDHLIAELNNVIERAVVRARESSGQDIRFSRSTADAYLPANTGCDETPFVTMPSLSDEGWVGGDHVLFHPTEAGQQAIAAELIRWSQSDEARATDTRRSGGGTSDQREPSEPGVRRIAGEITASGTDGNNSATRTVRLSEVHRLSADGFAPNRRVELRLESSPILIGRPITDPDGRLNVVIAIPQDLELGQHHLRIEGPRPDGTPSIILIALDVRPPKPEWASLALPTATLLAISSLLLALSTLGIPRRGRRLNG